ncbi:hypothetical protein FBQ82_00735 [Anaerolineae bacterium CFX7]|nr:hypothetical protein [Anaerolineae bacterium CFX7]
MFLQNLVKRYSAILAIRSLHLNNVIVTSQFKVSDWMPYATPGIGLLFAFKLAWDGTWILTGCLVFAAMMLIEPIRVWMKTRAIRDETPVIDFALICIERSAKDKPVLQTLDEASAALEHPMIRAIIQNSLQQFYNGETETQVLQNLVSQQTNSHWGLLIWTLVTQQRTNDDTKLREKVKDLLRQRFLLTQRARHAFVSTRRSVGILFLLCAALSAYLAISPSASVHIDSFQAIGSIALLALVWASHFGSTQMQTLQWISE